MYTTNGSISLAIHGVLTRDLETKELSRLLLTHLSTPTAPRPEPESEPEPAAEGDEEEAS